MIFQIIRKKHLLLFIIIGIFHIQKLEGKSSNETNVQNYALKYYSKEIITEFHCKYTSSLFQNVEFRIQDIIAVRGTITVR